MDEFLEMEYEDRVSGYTDPYEETQEPEEDLDPEDAVGHLSDYHKRLAYDALEDQPW